ncbi:uncharacterized protein LOC124496694 [Dermatophagoides farinae]|uniref:uncharacterized protein LOC124496694 n=1 Tax=Dermatophagoides farinae TaxID=6954 RepID=UPI003F605BBB
MDPVHNDNNNDDDDDNDLNGTTVNGPNKFSTHEQECIDYIESTIPANVIINDTDDDDMDDEERLNYERKLWNYFQSSAMAIAQLYSRDNLSTAHNVWSTFQQASTSVTCLYKESSEFHRKHYDRYRQIGYHKRTKELLNWIKKKKNLIRREELIAFLGGNGSPYHYHSHHLNNHHHHHTVHRSNRSGTRTTSNHNFRSSNLNNNNNNSILNRLDLVSKLTLSPDNNESDNDSINNNNVEPNLETFKEALHMRNPSVTSMVTNQTNHKRNNHDSHNNNNNHHHEDLHEFVDQQFHRHNESRKRTSSMDICMVDSSLNNNNKRTKFY